MGASSGLNVVAAYELAEKLGPGMFHDLAICAPKLTIPSRQDSCHCHLRRRISLPEPPLLQEVATGEGSGVRDSRTLEEVRCTGLDAHCPSDCYVDILYSIAFTSISHLWSDYLDLVSRGTRKDGHPSFQHTDGETVSCLPSMSQSTSSGRWC